jgi:hypothetical protein
MGQLRWFHDADDGSAQHLTPVETDRLGEPSKWAISDQKKLRKCHHAGSVRNDSGIPTPTISVRSGGSSS